MALSHSRLVVLWGSIALGSFGWVACSSDSPSATNEGGRGGGAGSAIAGSGAAPPSGAASVAGSANGGASNGGAASGGAALGGYGGSGAATAGASPSGGTRPATDGGEGGEGGGETGAAGPSTVPLVPAAGALLGQYYGDGSIAATTTKLGRTLKVHLTYWAWDDEWTKGATAQDIAAGRIPFVNWEPADIDFHDIVNGSLDETIDARAADAKGLQTKFFLDFAAEMNGDEAWSDNDAPLYVAAYRRIHDRFVAAGATNAVWVWCPNVTDTDGSNQHTLDYYPGDDYVDWTGVDGYNWGAGEWQSFDEVFEKIYPILAGKKKPILIGEMSSSEVGGDKAAWIKAILPALKTHYPLVRGVTWFDVDKERDWRISSSSATEAAFKEMAADPYFNP